MVGRHNRIALQIRIVDIKSLLVAEIWWERQSQQAALSPGSYLRADIEEWLPDHRSIADDSDNARLVEHEKSSRPIRSALDISWLTQASDNLDGLNLLPEALPGKKKC